jgi:fumarylacetoacetate (FAA) hydrolase family protein
MKDALGQVQGVKAELGAEAVRCPHCDTRINSNAIKLESHVVLSCSARSKSVTQRVANLVSIADEWGEDPLLIVKQEVDASMLHYAGMLDKGSYLDKFLQQGMAADRRYDKLPANFSREYLGYTLASLSAQQMQAEENNLVFKFGIWSQIVEKTAGPEDIQDLIVKFEEDLVSAVRSGVTAEWCKMDRDPALLTDMPDSKTLSDLEQELGWMQAGCPRDLENTVKQLQVQMKSIS